VDENKSGQVGSTFANPVLHIIEDIHFIESDAVKKRKILLNGKSFRRSIAIPVEFLCVFPNVHQLLLKIIIHHDVIE
jgi:hypothetical protein